MHCVGADHTTRKWNFTSMAIALATYHPPQRPRGQIWVRNKDSQGRTALAATTGEAGGVCDNDVCKFRFDLFFLTIL